MDHGGRENSHAVERSFRGFFMGKRALPQTLENRILKLLQPENLDRWVTSSEDGYKDWGSSFKFFNQRSPIAQAVDKSMREYVSQSYPLSNCEVKSVVVNRMVPHERRSVDGGMRVHIDSKEGDPLISVIFVFGRFTGGALKVANTESGIATNESDIINSYQMTTLACPSRTVYYFPGSIVQHAVGAVYAGVRWSVVGFYKSLDSDATLRKKWIGKPCLCPVALCTASSVSFKALQKHIGKYHPRYASQKKKEKGNCKCNQCGFTSTSEGGLRKHKYRKHIRPSPT